MRLIPSAPPSSPLDAIRKLLAYRLPSNDHDAREQWRDIVGGKSSLWVGIPNDRKETIRGFLVNFENEILKRAHKNFSFVNGRCVDNMMNPPFDTQFEQHRKLFSSGGARIFPLPPFRHIPILLNYKQSSQYAMYLLVTSHSQWCTTLGQYCSCSGD